MNEVGAVVGACEGRPYRVGGESSVRAPGSRKHGAISADRDRARGAAKLSEAAPRVASRAIACALITTFLLTLGCGQKQPEPAKRDPGLFTLGTQPAALPSGTVEVPTGPGAKDFEEGRRLLAQGRASEALPLLARAASDAPSNAQYQSLFAQALWATGAREEALVRYARAAQLSPDLRLQLAKALDDSGKSTDAIREYQGFLATDPSNARVSEELGHLLYRTGQYSNAAPLLRRAVEARGDDPVLQQELAYALEQSGQPAQAAEVYRNVLRVAPEADVTRGRLAEVLFQQGNKDEAIALTQEGLRRTPDVPILHRNLGSLLERSGRTAEAIQEYRAYARLAPNAPDVKEVIDRADRLGGGS
jgi:tetratricopeptide (TPR) repeat protein